ncbi:MAG: hypothetical protein HEQ22_11355 [Sphingopyxis sp.]|uniref:hypothetical protein n=1 Tax=Sphingopyxis sp. TaxID=1908224 RepID=UPI003D80C2BB
MTDKKTAVEIDDTKLEGVHGGGKLIGDDIGLPRKTGAPISPIAPKPMESETEDE